MGGPKTNQPSGDVNVMNLVLERAQLSPFQKVKCTLTGILKTYTENCGICTYYVCTPSGFPDTESRAEFIEDCVSSEIDKVELYDWDPFKHRPDYAVAVLDMADLYGYTLRNIDPH